MIQASEDAASDRRAAPTSPGGAWVSAAWVGPGRSLTLGVAVAGVANVNELLADHVCSMVVPRSASISTGSAPVAGRRSGRFVPV